MSEKVKFLGDVEVNGNLTVNETATIVNTEYENVKVSDNTITLRHDATGALQDDAYTGIVAKKYDGETDGMLVFDKNGTAYVGDEGDLQPLATRELTENDNCIPAWDGSKMTLTTSPIKKGSAKDSLQSGEKSVATAERALAQGYGVNAGASEAHAEGTYTQAIGAQSTARGLRTSAIAQGATAQGEKTIAEGKFSSAEGVSTNQFANTIAPLAGEIARDQISRGTWNSRKFLAAQGEGSHAEGKDTFARGKYSHTEGTQTYTEGENSHAEGVNAKAFAANAHAEGNNTEVYAENAHGEGLNNTVYGPHTHAEGGGNKIGITGWYILAYDHNSHTIEVCKTQQNPPASSLTGTNPDNLDLSSVLFNPDLCDIYVNGTYMHDIMVDVVSGNTIHFTGENWNRSTGGEDRYGNEDRFNENYLGLYLDPIEQLRHDSNTIYCLNKPAIGPIQLKEGGHIEGRYNEVYSREGHAEGAGNTVLGNCAHAEGYQNKMGPWANNAHAEGQQNTITGSVAHVEGIQNSVSGDFAHAEGNGNKASGNSAHIEGTSFIQIGQYGQGVIGTSYSESSGTGSHVEGLGSSTVDSAITLQEDASDLEYGYYPDGAHAEGVATRALGYGSHSEGILTRTTGRAAHAEGRDSKATGDNAHTEGRNTTASGTSSHAEGGGTSATGNSAHAEGSSSTASGSNAHAEGWNTTAAANNAHTEGGGTTASGESSHAEGSGSKATNHTAHAEGWKAEAKGQASHAEGNGTIANGLAQHAQGKWNVEDNANKYAHIVGGGMSDTDRKNIHTLDWNGNAYFKGGLTLGETTLTETELKSLKSGASNVEDITYVGVGESITFGNENTLPNGFITKIGGNSSEYGEGEENLINVANYKQSDDGWAWASWDINGNITLPGSGLIAGCILFEGYTTLSKDATFISFGSDQEPLDGDYPEYEILTNDGERILVTAGASHTFSAGTTITKITVSCYTDMVTWTLNKPKFIISVSKDLISINKEGTTNIITLEEGTGSITTQYPQYLGKTPTSISFSGSGISTSFTGSYVMFNDKAMNADGEVYVLEKQNLMFGSNSSYCINFIKNGEVCSRYYSTVMKEGDGYLETTEIKHSIQVTAGDVVSVSISVDGSVAGYEGLVTLEVYTHLGAQNFDLPEIPKLSLGIDNRYYNYIDFENNFAGILVDVIEFDGSEDEEWVNPNGDGNETTSYYLSKFKSIKAVSLSNAWFENEGYGGSMNGYALTPQGLEIQLSSFFIDAGANTSITAFRSELAKNPLKLLYVLPPEERRTIPLDEIEPLAITLGASNTLKFANCPAVCTVKYQEKG